MYSNPSAAIAEFEQILLSNSGEDAFESAIKLLAAKLIDEIETESGSAESFKIHENANVTYEAIQKLYEKASLKWPLLRGSDELEISPQHLVRSIRPLLGWKLRSSDLSWLDATLERLVARDAKGALGQYFTPREIIRMCVDILNPATTDRVMDPACGSGGFLFEAVRHSLHREQNAPSCLGIDFSARSVKVSTLLSAALDDSTIVISKANTLDGRAYKEFYPPEWQGFLCQDYASETRRAKSWGAWNQLGCDVLLTNPPFAGDIDELDLLDAYESQQDPQVKKAVVSREHLFLERAVDLLRPGGRLAIVLPQGVLANATAAYLRAWLLGKCRILGVIGLHQNAFMPYTGVKTAVLFLAKPHHGDPIPVEYPIFFTVSHSSGKDSSGRPSGTSDYDSITQSFLQFLHDQQFPWAASPSKYTKQENAAYETVMVSEVKSSWRLDAEHYDPSTRALERKISEISSIKLANLVETKIPRFNRKFGFEEISYLDISSIDNRTGLPFPSTISAEDAPSRASYLVGKGDVLVSTVRPERNVVAIVNSENGPPSVASNGFCVLRSKYLAPELLFAYCKTEAFRRMLSMHATASMYPTVNDKDVLNLPFLPPPPEIEAEVIELIQSGLAMIEKAQTQIRNAVAIMDKYVQSAESEN